ncbi:TetR family transcriptional regulator [Streptacidiphilus jiangxiensis]|uniref:DNA-binding transcriptional regulator, AcrR family n=1 Tax=Streptacidiphilus jiangxiensis TaxID=235985 RepID=A0A1H7YET4_STRJI|nr:TetR family transcriptional regulator [Streptacidiphilus jiangxiensis]SEM44394.1 DNA-binding transcriptional regulator, AcrR family [Streptacidiphilus jiangxiensis]
MSQTTGARQAQKQQSRRALLDAALQLLEHQSFSSLGMREVTREAGMSPAGFYRHFRDLNDLGVCLVEEALASLHLMIGAAFAEQEEHSEPDELIAHAVQVIADHVQAHRAHVRFIARERFGGVRPVREAIAAELERFTDEVARALALQPVSAGWSTEDVRMVAELYVDHMVLTAAALLEADAQEEQRITATARRQLRLISVGRRHWISD